MAVAMDTIIRGLMSTKSTRSRSTPMISSRWRQVMRSLMKRPSSSVGSAAWATIYWSSTSAVM